MNISLGIHTGHDRGACIIKDGKVIVAISQERLDRIKYSRSPLIPFDAIDSILKYSHISIEDISCIGISYDGIEGIMVQDIYKEELFQYYNNHNITRIPIYIVNHHDAHAYSTFFSSGYEKSLIFIADGAGDYIGNNQESETLYLANGTNISRISQRLQTPAIRRIGDDINYVYPRMPQIIRNSQISIGRKYEQITHLIGFGWGEAGKTMGLASYGKSFLNFEKEKFNNLNFSLTYSDILSTIHARKILSGKTYNEYLQCDRANIARTVQDFVESTITNLISNFFNEYNIRNICLGGGLFLNCLTNQKIIDECNPDKIFILPASGDDGQALGCAYYAYLKQFGNIKKFKIELPYLGLSYSNEYIETVISSKNVPYKCLNDNELIKEMAYYIKSNKIIALHRGRTEIGPRALCHRSILANPTDANMKDILNKRVKHREPFRPFAPTVIKSEQYNYFDLKTDSDYMLLATNVKEKYRENLSSITHVDNTARIQTVSKQSDEFLYNFLLELKEQIGFPIVLNTSFNVAGQPIVESPLDAINTFLTNDIDVLIIGNYVIDKSKFIN